jgi:bifunctional DNase/RNase
MVRVTIDTIRVSLVSPQRIVVLREEDGERHIPIWVGPYEAEALTLSLRGTNVQRPLTHDLLNNTIEGLGATVSHIVISELRNEIFYASIILDLNGKVVEVDARPSDAINLAVRASAAIFVGEQVLQEAGVIPELGMEEPTTQYEEENLGVFADFLESLDLDDLGD